MSQSPPLGKPSGILLEHHVAHVVAESLALLEAFPFLAKKYTRLTNGSDLKAHVIGAASDHDLGKAHRRWQRACKADYELYRTWRKSRGLAPDSVDADDYARYEAAIKRGEVPRPHHLMKSGVRHEFASLPRMKGRGRSTEAHVAVAAHHSKLSRRFAHRWEKDGLDEGATEAGPYATWFKTFKVGGDKYSKGKADEKSVAQAVRARYRFDLPRALLQLADTRASRMESLGRVALPKVQEWCFKWPETREWRHVDGTPSYRPVQRLALEMAERDDFVSILRAPTGSGKTAASLLWANRQIECERADRLVVAMPTRFTANALAKGAEDLVGETGLYHSSAFFTRYSDLGKSERAQAKEPHLLAQKLVTPVTVCTVDHLLIALTGAREHHHSTFAFLAHAAVVFDEADFYDAFIQANLRFLLDALRALEVPVLIMSATVPESAREYYGVTAEIVDADAAEAAERKPPARRVRFGGEVAAPADARKTLARMLECGNGIVYANTVARAMAYHQFLQKLQAKHDPERQVEIVLYHSRFTEPHKKAKEDRLVDLLNAKAWQKGTPKAIAILTQIGEMSINISTANMLSEACPWDRLSQRIGRLNRFGESPDAECVVVAPMKDGKLYPAPYGEYVQKQGWQASAPLERTVEHIRSLPELGMPVEPVQMTCWVNELYKDAEEPTGAARANIRSYEQLVRESLIVLPDIDADDEDASAHDWTARQIGPQATVLTKAVSRLANFGDWQEHKLYFGLEVPTYQVEKDAGSPTPQLSKCSVEIGFGDEPTVLTYYYAVSGEDDDACVIPGRDVYNAERGLHGVYDIGDAPEDLDDDEGF